MRAKMSRLERAKQFMPFAALKGYSEALRGKEKIMMQKAELSEEYLEELNHKFLQIKEKDVVTISYFHIHEYLKITGSVTKIDRDLKKLEIHGIKIALEDIYDINSSEIEIQNPLETFMESSRQEGGICR